MATKKGWTCAATAAENMRIPAGLNKAEAMIFFLTEVLEQFTNDFYSLADANTAKKGFKIKDAKINVLLNKIF